MAQQVTSFLGIGSDPAKAAEKAAAAASRRQLAELARQQALVDQQGASGGKRNRGRSLLTFLGAEGTGELG
jgi:hypothetical protein